MILQHDERQTSATNRGNFPGGRNRAERLEFVGLQPRWEYFRTYDRIDIALDTLPYNGITTTCDAHLDGNPGGEPGR